MVLIPSQPLLCLGCWNCLGGSDDLIRVRQLSHTSVITGSIEKQLGSSRLIFLEYYVSHQIQECMCSKSRDPQVLLEILELKHPLGLLIIWVEKLDRHISFQVVF